MAGLMSNSVPYAGQKKPKPEFGESGYEDTSIQQKVAQIGSDASNPLNKMATTTGLKNTNRRGLLSSSLSAGAAQAEVLKAATPIAMQESAQQHQAKLSMGMQAKDIAAQQGTQQRDIQSRQDLLMQELGSREKMQLADQAAEKERQGIQLSSNERLALQDMQAANERLDKQIGSQERLQQSQFGNNEKLQLSEQEFRGTQAGLDREAQERIAGLNLSGNERGSAASLAANFESTYSQMVSSITANTELPADARQQMLNHAAAVRDSNLALVEQMYGITLNWAPTPVQTDEEETETPVPADNQQRPYRPGGRPGVNR